MFPNDSREGIDPSLFLERVDDELYMLAMRFLIEHFPNATWEVSRFPDKRGRLIYPYLLTDVGYFVEVTVIVDDIRRSHLQAVMDEQGAVIFEGATSQEIQSAIQDCFLVCVGLHGLSHRFWSYVKGDPQTTSESHGISKEDDRNLPVYPERREFSEPDPECPPEPVMAETSPSVDPEDPIFVLKDVDAVMGEKGAYYLLTLDYNDEEFQARVPLDMLEDFDQAAIKINEKIALAARRVSSPQGPITVVQRFRKVPA